MKYKQVRVSEIVDFLGKEIKRIDGDWHESCIDNIADVERVSETSLDWINISKVEKELYAENSKANVLIVDESVVYTSKLQEQKKVLIVVNSPRDVLAKITTRFFVDHPKSGIHPSAIIDERAVVDPTAHIGAGCVIGNATIGANTVLMPNVVIYDDVTIGNNCLIQAGAVIGTDGLGCSRDGEGKLTKFPHIGGVKIGNDVEIGANCQIAKGAFSDTIIENGCKINGLCFIAHNGHLAENVWITGDTMLCGSVHVEKNATIFSNVIIREQRHIGEGSTVGMGAVVTKNVPDHEIWVGSPAHKMEK